MSSIATKLTKYYSKSDLIISGQTISAFGQTLLSFWPTQPVSENARICFMQPSEDRGIGSILDLKHVKPDEILKPGFHHIKWCVEGQLACDFLVFLRMGPNGFVTIEYDIMNPAMATFQPRDYESLGHRMVDADEDVVLEAASGYYGSAAMIYYHCRRTRERGANALSESPSAWRKHLEAKADPLPAHRIFVASSGITKWLAATDVVVK